jgi:hypothetical protein
MKSEKKFNKLVKERSPTMPNKAVQGNPKVERMDYDNLFKTALHLYFWEALKILAPKLYEAADKRVAPVFLEQELQKITLDLGEGSNRTDLLVRIKLKNGFNELVLCHLEIQGKGGNDLTIRMYRYKQMIYLQYGEEPIGVAVTTAPRPHGEKTSYTWEKFGVRVTYDYLNVPVIKLEDTVLLAEDNRIGLILYAAKCVWESGDDEGKKFQYLRTISDLWAKRGWDKDDKRIILLAVNYLLNLKDKSYAQQYVAHMGSLKMNEEDREMYVSVFERVYKEEGREEGREEGKVEMARNLLLDGFPLDAIAKSSGLPPERIQSLVNP